VLEVTQPSAVLADPPAVAAPLKHRSAPCAHARPFLVADPCTVTRRRTGCPARIARPPAVATRLRAASASQVARFALAASTRLPTRLARAAPASRAFKSRLAAPAAATVRSATALLDSTRAVTANH
jgi:hypothetical protein